MFDKKLLHARRLHELMEMSEQKWLELSPKISQKQDSPVRGPQDPCPLVAALCVAFE